MVSEFYPCSMVEKYVRWHICFSIYLEKKNLKFALCLLATCHIPTPATLGAKGREQKREKERKRQGEGE